MFRQANPGKASGGKCRPFAGRFLLGDTLGVGGCAQVVRAVDEDTGRDVAVKRLHPQLYHHRTVVEMFDVESRAYARLNGAGAPALVYRPPERPLTFMVVDFVPGNRLCTALRRNPGTRAKLEAFEAVCGALIEVHRHGIIHRDVKPDNIIISGSGPEAKASFVDFGFSKVPLHQDFHFYTKYPFGTPEYAAPEFHPDAKRPTDFRSDVYSLGVMMFEALSGSLPFCAPHWADRESLFLVHLHETAPPLRLAASSSSRAITAMVAKALERNPERRFQSVLELREEIRSCISLLPAIPATF